LADRPKHYRSAKTLLIGQNITIVIVLYDYNNGHKQWSIGYAGGDQLIELYAESLYPTITTRIRYVAVMVADLTQWL
jgi:hypothetical protein